MAKNFGVKFTNGTNDILSVSGYFKTRPDKGQKRLFKSFPQIAYIHPDSLLIFEPKEGDILIDSGNIIIGKSAGGNLIRVSNDGITMCEPPFKIIQRNNKPFIMPGVEV